MGSDMGVPINRLDSIWPNTKTAVASAPVARTAGWRDSPRRLELRLETLLAEHPKLAIAAAAAAGLLLGWIVKRK